ncbi:MAG: hypothetical protein DBX55_00130 [Verrucomicrobia bacterium]|nr:MAG: hypothetical protein DBX55_00130 [Verrucomicrobiota bacterium]
MPRAKEGAGRRSRKKIFWKNSPADSAGALGAVKFGRPFYMRLFTYGFGFSRTIFDFRPTCPASNPSQICSESSPKLSRNRLEKSGI